MELDQLKLFTDLVREQSFTKVAEKNFLTQPAVSLRIRNLEEELNTKLLERTTRKVLVTEEGRILYEYARDILRKAEEVKMLLLERQDKMVGMVRLAIVQRLRRGDSYPQGNRCRAGPPSRPHRHPDAVRQHRDPQEDGGGRSGGFAVAAVLGAARGRGWGPAEPDGERLLVQTPFGAG